MAEYDQSLTDLLKRTIQDAQELARSEIALAKTELRAEVRRLAAGGIALSTGAVSGIIAVIFLLTAAAWAIPQALAWPVWTGFAIVGGIVAIVAFVLVAVGRRKLRVERPMPLTTQTIKENTVWMRAQKS